MLFGFLVALVFGFVARIWGELAAGVAALLALCLPRLFFYAGLAVMDAPIVTMWFATLYAYYLALSSRGWCVLLGIVLGMALATKHNALLLPVVIGLHYLWVAYRHGCQIRPDGGWLGRLWSGFVRKQIAIVPAIALLGPVVFIALWPWMWFDTIAHLVDWVGFHLNHVHYNYEYLGRNWNTSGYPWHAVFVTAAVTVPVITIVAAGLGVFAISRKLLPTGTNGDAAPGVLLGLSALIAIAPFVVGSAPIFGAGKHWIAALISVCVCAGVGVRYAAQLVPAYIERLARFHSWTRSIYTVFPGLLAIAVVIPAAGETYRAQPYALSYYNALAGGAPGGATLGMNRQFWGYAARGVLEPVHRIANQSGLEEVAVYSHDASPAWSWYRRLGLVDPSLVDAGREWRGIMRSKIAFVIHELHFRRHEYMIWKAYGTTKPHYVLTFDGVPLVSVYVRE